MSMPEFPNVCGLGLTCDKVLELMMEAIAMQELSLSHVINASAEEIHHLSAMSACKNDPHCYTQNVVVINKSVNLIIERVNQCKTLLKCELDAVLEALERCSCKKCHCPQPNYGCACSAKSQLLLLTDQHPIFSGLQAIYWKKYCREGCAINWDSMFAEGILLENKKSYQLHMVFSFAQSGCSPVPISLQLNIETGGKCRKISIPQCLLTDHSKEKLIISATHIINLKEVLDCYDSKMTVLVSVCQPNLLELSSLLISEL